MEATWTLYKTSISQFPNAMSGTPKIWYSPKGEQILSKAESCPEHLERNMFILMKEKFYLIQPSDYFPIW